MADELPRLRATRAANKGVITKLIGESEAILETGTAIDDKTRNRLIRIETMLKEKIKLVTDLDEKIVSVCKLEDIEKEIDDAESLKMRVMDAIANIALTTTPPKSTTPTFAPPSDPSGSQPFNENILAHQPPSTSGTLPPIQTSPTTGPSSAISKLPKLTLPKFKGEVTQFKSFWDTFASAVHSKPTLTKIAKFNYLVAQLEGSASRAIAGLPITEENYEAAVDILTKRFGKPQQQIAAHMDELLKISVCSTEKPAQLRYLYDKISVNVRGLEALGVKSQQYGSLLIPIIMAKLPPEIRIHVARNTSQDVWEIEALLDLLQHEIEAREISEKIKAVTPTETFPPKRQQDFNWKPRNVPPSPTAGTFLVDNQSPPFTPTCVYCSAKHFSASCENVTDISARKSILAREKRCFKCLKRGHHQD